MVRRNRLVAPAEAGRNVLADQPTLSDDPVVRVQRAGADGFAVQAGPYAFGFNLAGGSAGSDLHDTSGVANVYVGNAFGSVSFR